MIGVVRANGISNRRFSTTFTPPSTSGGQYDAELGLEGGPILTRGQSRRSLREREFLQHVAYSSGSEYESQFSVEGEAPVDWTEPGGELTPEFTKPLVCSRLNVPQFQVAVSTTHHAFKREPLASWPRRYRVNDQGGGGSTVNEL